MTVASPVARNDYLSSGIAGPYPFTFPIQAASHLVVVRRNLTTGGETTLMQSVDYTLAGTSWANGGSWSLLASLATGYALTARRVVPLTQLVDLRNQGAFFAEVHESEFDLLVQADQQQQDQIDRSLRLPSTEAGTALNTTLPSVELRANKALIFDASGNPTVGSGSASTIPDVSLVQVVDTIASLKALAIPSGAVQYFVRGYYTAGDGGGGVFRWNASDTAADNLGTVLIPNAAPGTGRWNRILNAGPISIRHFGAKVDGATNDLTAINAAVAAAGAVAGGAMVDLTDGTTIVTGSINMASNVILLGRGARSVIKVAADTVLGAVRCVSISNFRLRDFSIDGGGQTTDVATGFKACQGIRIDNCSYFVIERVNITKCGIKNAASPTTDSAFAGLGIIITALTGESAFGSIRDCRISLIAGGGTANGDGIAISGYGGAAILAHDISVENCWFSTCGRHCVSLSGAVASGLPSGITIRKCYMEKAGLCGLDFEDATRSVIDDCRITSCGNDQTYYDPATTYGSTYRLLAGVATGGIDNNDITINNCRFISCYYGITYGATTNLRIHGCTLESGTREDVSWSSGQAPFGLIMSNTKCLSTGQNMQLTFTSTDSKDAQVFYNCLFTKAVLVSQCYDVIFQNCNFLAGLQFTSANVERPSFLDCTFEDFAGSAVTHSATGQFVRNATFRGCKFIGTGNLVSGIINQYNDATDWIIEGCEFIGLTGTAISCTNGNAQPVYASITGNVFRSCAAGIVASQAVVNGKICNNIFSTISGYCIDISSISSGLNMVQMTICENVAGATVTNGLRIGVSTGAWDFCIVGHNNFHTPSGTKWSVSGGNASGFTVNNITT